MTARSAAKPSFTGTSPVRRARFSVVSAGLLLAAATAPAQTAPSTWRAGELPGRLVFSGMLDADFASDYGTFDRVRHVSGLEADLATTLNLSPTLNAVVRTTMRDGTVPEAGAGNTWTPLRFDGAQVNWQANPQTTIMAGDLVAGTGYFRYYRYKRSSVVVGEHSLRGAGFHRGGILLHAGVATDTAGQLGAFSVFGQWTRRLNENMQWSPSMRYTMGIPKAYPFELGISFEGQFENTIEFNAHVGMNYWSTSTDPGSFFLLEPRYTYEPYFFSATVFYSDKGEVPSPNTPRQPYSWNRLDDLLIQAEPGIALNPVFSTSVSLELRDRSMDRSGDLSFWVLPMVYVYPAPRAQWRSFCGIAKPLTGGAAGDPQFTLGSEINMTF